MDFQILSVTPELARGRDAYFITFNIREGQSFSLGNVTVRSDIADVDAGPYREAVRIRGGQTYSPRLIDNTISRLENLATQQGLRFVRVEPGDQPQQRGPDAGRRVRREPGRACFSSNASTSRATPRRLTA